MNESGFNFKKGLKFLPQILLVGIGIGSANFVMHGENNWLQWTIQAMSTSLIIGYVLVVLGANRSWLESNLKPSWKRYAIVALFFVLAALVATETEQIIRSSVFSGGDYKPLSAGKMYLYNSIISLVLGFSFFQFDVSKKTSGSEASEQDIPLPEGNDPEVAANDPIRKIPIKQGENIHFIDLDQVVYFEAHDNYSFVHTTGGQRKLCDYSLRFLESRLSEGFSRVHRKYIVNQYHITQIRPHLNGRYQIAFPNPVAPITSSKSYTANIRKLIKIE